MPYIPRPLSTSTPGPCFIAQLAIPLPYFGPRTIIYSAVMKLMLTSLPWRLKLGLTPRGAARALQRVGLKSCMLHNAYNMQGCMHAALMQHCQASCSFIHNAACRAPKMSQRLDLRKGPEGPHEIFTKKPYPNTSNLSLIFGGDNPRSTISKRYKRGV